MQSGIAFLPRAVPRLTLSKIAALVLVSFVWTALLTGTGGSVLHVMAQTVKAVASGFSGDNRSIDAINLLSFARPSPEELFADHERDVVEPARALDPEAYYPSALYAAYPVQLRADERLPLSPLGAALQQGGLDPRPPLTVLGAVLIRLFELLLPLGVLYALVRNTRVPRIDPEAYLFAVASLIFIGLTIVLPVLSVEYGVYRAMQQSLFIVGIFLVIGSLALFDLLGALFRKGRTAAPWSVGMTHVLIALFFLFSTGALPQLFGGNMPLLHLNNAGPYYESFLTTPTDALAIDYLAGLGAYAAGAGVPFDVQADKYAQQKIFALSGIVAQGDVLPALMRRDAFIFLSESNVVNDSAVISQNGNRVVYDYPLQFLEEHKTLLYDSGGARIYK